MKCIRCGFPLSPGLSFCPNCRQIVLPESYDMPEFNQACITGMFMNLGLNIQNYILCEGSTGTYAYTSYGKAVNVDGQDIIINFNEMELILFACSKLEKKRITHIFRIRREEIKRLKVAGFFSKTITIETTRNTLKFKLKKKSDMFPNQKVNAKTLKSMYNLS